MTRDTNGQARACADAEMLMSKLAAGDARAFGALFDRFAPGLLSFSQLYAPNARRAERLLQATFEQLHRERDRYRAGSCVRSWVFRIAAQNCLAELQRPDRGQVRSSGPRRRPADPPQQRVRDAIAALPGHERAVIHLHRVEGMSFAQIAEVLELSEQAVRSQALRTYGLLGERLYSLFDRGDGS